MFFLDFSYSVSVYFLHFYDFLFLYPEASNVVLQKKLFEFSEAPVHKKNGKSAVPKHV